MKPEERQRMIGVLLVLFVVLVVLLSVRWGTGGIDPMVLLVGIFVAAIVWMAQRRGASILRCASCDRAVMRIPDAAFCPYCGKKLP